MTSLRLRMPLVLAVTLVLHLTVLSRLRVENVRPDALLLVAIVAGLVAGAERGAVAGFCTGLLADLFLQTPFGLSALAYALVGFGVGSIQAGILRAAWWIPVVTALAASAGGMVLFGILGAMVGQSDFVGPRLVVIALLVGVMNAILALPALRVVGWAYRASSERSYPA